MSDELEKMLGIKVVTIPDNLSDIDALEYYLKNSNIPLQDNVKNAIEKMKELHKEYIDLPMLSIAEFLINASLKNSYMNINFGNNSTISVIGENETIILRILKNNKKISEFIF